MKLQEKIYYCRKKAGLSQEVLAEQLGVSRQAVSKWETGEAVPEIGKLLLLAKVFDVTTDWLLSEEEPSETVEEKKPQEMAEEQWKEYRETGPSNWVESVPGVIGTLLRRYGWLFGVYTAAIGAAFTLFGVLARVISGQMLRNFENSMRSSGYPFGSSLMFFGENGVEQSLNLGSETGNLWSFSGILANNPVTIIGTVMIIIGVFLMIAGVVIAVILKKKSRNA